MRLLRLAPARALAVYAHPDDADVACGGTLSLWAASQTTTRLVIVCDGAKGTHVAADDERALRRRRFDELTTAAKLIGVGSVECWGYPDGEVTNDVPFRERLVREIRSFRPDVVLGPDPTATFFGGVYVNHRDHRELGWALLDAVAPASAMPKYFPSAGEAHAVTRLLLSGTHEPDVAVDVSASIEQKVAAVLAHASQTDSDDEWVRSAVLGRAEPVGREVGVRYAEAFRSVEFSG